MTDFPIGSVGHNLMQMRGTWHDTVSLFNLDGSPLVEDSKAGSPGESPFENLVYIDFDGEVMTQTNIHIAGRAPSTKTFGGKLIDGVLVFDSLGPGAYENIGVSGGPNVLIYNGRSIEEAWQTYVEPDFIVLTGPDQRMRTTVLYRHGVATRTLTAYGKRLSRDCVARSELDPRGTDGPVHETPFVSNVWADE